ncbi:13522_t:CDS:2, partial [Gigaspora rosea]
SYYESIDQEYSDQDMSSCNLYDTDNMEFDQEFDNNLDYGNLESIYKNEFSDNINSDSLDDECEPISNNMDDEPKTFDRTKPDINWNHESPYGLFGNFTNMAIFIWATKRLFEIMRRIILWAESPLFGLSNLVTMQGSFNCGDFVKYNSTSETIEIVPQFLRSKQYSPHSSQELYLVEESELFIIDPSNFLLRYQQITNQKFKNISEQQTNSARLQMSSHYELRLLPGPLDPILHDRYQYMLQDAYHAVAGK